MATGTGKTRTIIGLMYRLLKAERFRRILFLVDRNALGQQARTPSTKRRWSKTSRCPRSTTSPNWATWRPKPKPASRSPPCRPWSSASSRATRRPPSTPYDCIIVDEAHRGYTLDQDMTEGELAVRDQAQYLSSYRRVLDYFDAVKIGLTATPAKHTSEIFGKPGLHLLLPRSRGRRLADRPRTADPLRDPAQQARHPLRQGRAGQRHQPRHRRNRALPNWTTNCNFDVESFNRRVINEDFNRVICEQLAEELDPFGEEKTLIFCATDLHADMVKRLLDDAFKDKYGDEYDEAAVRKITGAVRQDRPTDPPLQERALPEHRHHRRPADHRHRRAGHLPPRLSAPGPLAHPLRADDRPRHPPLRRHRQDRLQDLRPGGHLRGARSGQHHAAAGQGPERHARTTGRRTQQPGQLHRPRQPPGTNHAHDVLDATQPEAHARPAQRHAPGRKEARAQNPAGRTRTTLGRRPGHPPQAPARAGADWLRSTG